MPTINPALPSDGDDITALSVNTPFQALISLVNGNLDEDNLATGGVATASIADGAVTPAKLSSAARWWEELGRTTLSVAGDTISLTGLTAKKYIRVIIAAQATGGTLNTRLRFNNDTGNNYAYRKSENGAADTSSTAQSNIVLGLLTAAQSAFTIADVINIAAQEKLVSYIGARPGTAGAANLPDRTEGFGKWANTADQITRVDVYNDGTGDFAIGSEVIVLGHD